MRQQSKHELAAALQGRYLKATKGGLLDEFCAVTGYHRRHAVRLLRHGRFGDPRLTAVGAENSSGRHDLQTMLEDLRLVVGVLRAGLCARSDLAAEHLLLRQQLLVMSRSTRPQPRLRARDKLFWLLTRMVRRDWRRHLVLVHPRAGAPSCWCTRRWCSAGTGRAGASSGGGAPGGRSRRPTGRPRLAQAVRDLIRQLSEEHRRWGTERIRGESLNLGIAAGNGSIRCYRCRPAPRPPSQTWGTFLRNHTHAIWAADLLTVQMPTCKTLYVLFFISHGRREPIHVAVTAHPTAAWLWRQLTEATPWGRYPDYLVRDRGRVSGGDFASRAKAMGAETLLTPFRAPKANAIAERVVRTLRNECLDHILILNEQHLRAVLAEYVAYYNTERPHRTLALEPPLPTARSPVTRGDVRSRAVLGGLHHVYAGDGFAVPDLVCKLHRLMLPLPAGRAEQDWDIPATEHPGLVQSGS